MTVKILVQNEKGSRLRYRYNEHTLEYIQTDQLLAPADYQYGFIPGTAGDDGDCLDFWLISDTNYKVGTQVECTILGLLRITEEYRNEREDDYKIIGCPVNETVRITNNIISKIKNFTIEIFKKYPEVILSFGSFLPPEQAESLIRKNSL